MINSLYIFAAITPWLMILCYYDCKFRRLPNFLTLGMVLIVLIGRLGYGGFGMFADGFVGGLICGLFLFIPFIMGGAGGGDIKMLLAVGSILGISQVGTLLLSTSIAGIILAIVMILAGLVDARRLKHYFRTIFDWRYDKKEGKANLPNKNDERVRVPFGIAIACGTWATLIFEIFQKVNWK